MANLDFAVQIQRWADQAKGRLDQFKLAFALRMTERVKEYTPVLTGRLRASWQPVDLTADNIVIATNVEYAKRINYGFNGKDSLGREYHQVGVGMVEKALADAPEIAAEALKDIAQ